jgi:hypothetical protein
VLADADGTYKAEIALPRDLPLERYEVYASTIGDTTHSPALSP